MARAASNPGHRGGRGVSSSRSNPQANRRTAVKGLGRFLFLSTISFIGVLNIQPWMSVAKEMKSAITFVPFLAALTKIPWFGGWIVWFSNQDNALSAIAVGLWSLTQYCEMTDIPWIRQKRWLVYIWEFAIIFIHFPPYEGGYTALIEDFPYLAADSIQWWNLLLSVVCAFAFEFILNILKKQ